MKDIDCMACVANLALNIFDESEEDDTTLWSHVTCDGVTHAVLGDRIYGCGAMICTLRARANDWSWYGATWVVA